LSGISEEVIDSIGDLFMQANTQKKLGDEAFAETDGRPPFPFRTVVSLVLLAGNLLVAAIYFHILNP